jgi:CRISPR-associated protein Cpf1
MNQVKSINDFTNLYSLSKTLRFRLIPQGKTLEHIEKNGIIQKDRKISDDYGTVKRIIDDYHRIFIEKCLRSSRLSWDALAQAIKEYRTSRRNWKAGELPLPLGKGSSLSFLLPFR